MSTPGRRQYAVEDQEGRVWLVFRGDPAYEVVRQCSLKGPVVLPMSVLRSGSLEGVDYGRVARAVERLCRYQETYGADEDTSRALVRAVSLMTCLDHLRGLAILSEEESNAVVS